MTIQPNEPSSPDNFVVLYRWRLHPASENTFIEGWSRLTELLRQRGSLGSRLHRGSDGVWYSYAQWPSAKARDDAFALGPLDEAATAKIKSAIDERLPEITLDPVADYLDPLKDDGA